MAGQSQMRVSYDFQFQERCRQDFDSQKLCLCRKDVDGAAPNFLRSFASKLALIAIVVGCCPCCMEKKMRYCGGPF